MGKAPYSVEWLSKSSQGSADQHELPTKESFAARRLKPHIPCLTQPQQPTSYFKDSVQVKAPTLSSPKTSREDIKLNRIDCPSEMNSVSEKLQSSFPSLAEPESPWHSGGADWGYGSEAARSDGQSQEEGEDISKLKAPQRLRTAFTSEQIYNLEKTFKRHKYLGASERLKLAAKLQLSEIQIKTWFQNRRMKMKRQLQDMQSGAFYPLQLSSFQIYGHPSLAVFPYSFHPEQQTCVALPALDTAITARINFPAFGAYPAFRVPQPVCQRSPSSSSTPPFHSKAKFRQCF
nr:PREDICTED: homeobox protein VENTX [Latimeria chalumnae]|eukprot:XP_014346167.1 PREDICTED: homeobox protein VENTX [Latimeria chalumnae]